MSNRSLILQLKATYAFNHTNNMIYNINKKTHLSLVNGYPTIPAMKNVIS